MIILCGDSPQGQNNNQYIVLSSLSLFLYLYYPEKYVLFARARW
jgi:hypothetical protein